MAKKLSSVLGVDLGSRYIKVVEVRTQGKEPMLNALGMIDTPEGAIDHTGVFNPEAVGTALKDLIKTSGATVPNVIVSIAGQASVLVRTLEVPRMNATELREHMQWEINRNIPFAESNVVSDYRPLTDEDPNSPNMDVVMAISPQSAIDTIVTAIKQAKRIPAAIDVEPLSVARSLVFSYGEDYQGETICFVDMGHKTTAINIYREGKLLMPRQIPVGGEMITKALADSLNLPLDEAEKLKMERCEVPATAGADAGFGAFDMGFAAPATDGPTPTEEFQPYNPFAVDSGTAYTPPAGSEPTAYAPMPEAAPEPSPFAPMPDANPDPSPFAPMPDATADADGASVGEAAPFDPTAAATPDYGMNPFEPAPDPAFTAPPADAPAYAPLPVATVDPEVERLYQIFSPVLEEFVSEIRRSVDYFRSRGGDINRVVLAGGTSKLKGIAEYVGRTLAMECDGYDSFRRLNINSKKVAPGVAEEMRQDYMIAVGNALHIFFE